ncbi:carbohydrate kinase family protein [Actinacidiphila bryophytorum]|uniref:Fructokinase n=1 Tax=Actinacidiphila bryophytorum TaxID=1436133 RepID=A0A9W4MIG0_9ACTN|nr:carbohydrate kinase [Actinacidiphila bryophytorum]MBM9437127.1 carbohydrate kinase [Actinacidiphila bryophytorum]MBN6545287.1 carbohydrate kinase [Actinacidiphila bryophytorum]CAG7646759.1 Fructokinase [Actinacidiphila bryophytorum]
MTDFLTIGESVADIVRTPGRPDVAHPGGSSANVAYGLARLGRRAALLTQIGQDEAGRLIRDHLVSAGVELLTDGQRGAATPTAVVTLDGQGAASYDFAIGWTLRPVEVPAGVRHVHLGSIGAVQPPGAAAALEVTAGLRASATVSYDPNVRPALLGDRARAAERVERCVALSDVVKASDEDLRWLYPGEPAGEVARRWLGLGPAAVFVTLGAQGALAFTAAGQVSAAPVPVEVADTVGAGDAFMAAALDTMAALGLTGATARAGLAAGLDGPALAAMLHRAGAAAALTVSRAGANPPDAAELAAALEAAGSVGQ